MNKSECKKYVRYAFKALSKQKKTLSINNLAIEIEEKIKNESKIYIAYGKIALYTLLNSATEITETQLSNEIDIISELYSSDNDVILKSQKLI